MGAANAFAMVIAVLAWVLILTSPAWILVPRLRRLWTAPLQRRRSAGKVRRAAMAQARRDARTAVLEDELNRYGPF